MAKNSRSDAMRKHAQVYGTPGERPRLAGLLYASWPLLVLALIFGYLLRAAFPWPRVGPTLVGAIFIALAVLLAAMMNAVRHRLAAFVKGARGEERVAHELAFLDAGYHVFHGLTHSRGVVMPRGGDYDHVVVGPTGVFVIETKSWSAAITAEDGRLLYGGREPTRDPLAQVKTAARDLRRQMEQACEQSVPVQAVVCFATDTLQGESRGVSGVIACNVRVLGRVIQEPREDGLSDAALARVVAFLSALA